jgi:hypothetical protein
MVMVGWLSPGIAVCSVYDSVRDTADTAYAQEDEATVMRDRLGTKQRLQA